MDNLTFLRHLIFFKDLNYNSKLLLSWQRDLSAPCLSINLTISPILSFNSFGRLKPPRLKRALPGEL